MHLTWKKLTGIELPLGTGGRREGDFEEQGPVSPGNFSGPESCSVFTVFTFKIKVSIISKMIK